ncbi:MAG: hypothetical protein EBY97_08805, partial [Burkholderiaceae bacterium]|nr:hypothetical protein [Burkholderiaceae bacterium]
FLAFLVNFHLFLDWPDPIFCPHPIYKCCNAILFTAIFMRLILKNSFFNPKNGEISGKNTLTKTLF